MRLHYRENELQKCYEIGKYGASTRVIFEKEKEKGKKRKTERTC